MSRCLFLYLLINYYFECFVSIKVPIRDPQVRKNEPPDHVIPYSEHENIPDPKYVPGNWLKPLKNRTKFEFTPQRLYSQVRRSTSVKKLPRKEALKKAHTDIEKEEAARLKETVSDKKINTFYTEEGFEDAAYDHAGHIRDADFKQDYLKDQQNQRVKNFELRKEAEDSEEREEENTEKPYKFYSSWEESGDRKTRHLDRFADKNIKNRGKYDKIIYPRKNSSGGINSRLIVENEIDLLEKDIEKEMKEAEKGAETEVPENLKELKDSDYDDEEEEFDNKSEDYQDDDSFEYGGTSGFRIVAAEHPGYVGSFYSTELPKSSSNNQTLKKKEQILIVNTPKIKKIDEIENAKEYKILEKPKSSEFKENYVYPTLSQVYETWKRRGVERMYETSKESTEDHFGDNFNKKLKRIDEIKPKKSYYVMVRPRKINGTNFDVKKSIGKELDNKTTAGEPEKSGQVFSTAESGKQSYSFTVPGYRYQRKREPHKETSKRKGMGFGQEDRKLVSMTKMVPPSRISRSEYAEYHNLGRNGSIQPQHDRPRMVKTLSHKSALRFGGLRPRYFVTTNQKDNEKVLNGLNDRLISRKFVIVRKKRSLLGAPIIVDQVLDAELGKRFPENPDRDQEQENQSLELTDDEEEEEEEEEGKVEVEVPEFNYGKVAAQNTQSKNTSDDKSEENIDEEKYPFYNLLEHPTALKYVINPSFVPRKTLGGSEFYDSRDNYMTCGEMEPTLAEAPEKEEVKGPKLTGLGDKLLCLKEKYFDEEPLDNPLFIEKQIEAPTMPTEMDPGLLRARFEGLTDFEQNSQRRISDLTSMESKNEEEKWNNHAKKYRKRKKIGSTISPYQREVYDDVMGTIKNLATMYKGIHVLSTRAPPKKRRQESREKNDQVRINTSSRDVVIPVRRRVRPKLGGYRTNRVSYRTRPIKAFKGVDGKVVGFLKTVRVHKRDLENVGSNLENVGVFDSRKIKPGVQVEKKVEEKNSRPRGAVKFGRFEEPRGGGRRNEPRYTAVRQFDEILEVEKVGQGDKKSLDRYDVHEEVQETPEEIKVEAVTEIYKPAANENTETDESGEENEEYEETEEDNGEENENDDGSEYAEDSESKSESEEASHDAEKNMAEVSEGEKEFERFSYRPFSSYESYYDPKYADLGPRVNKPAFHHPSFDSLESNKKDKSKESEEGYVFPWHKEEEDASEESRRYERYSGRHEFPWEHRERIRRERGKGRHEWSPEESKIYFRKVYPWERDFVPWKYGGRRTHNFWPDDEIYQRQKYPKSKFKFKKLMEQKVADLSTTSTPQIPPTEEISKIESTTPLILTTTPIVYTLSPRRRRPVTQRNIESLKIDQTKAQSSPPGVVKTPPDLKRLGSRIEGRSSLGRRFRVISTTSRPSRRTLESTTASSRKVEHRSKVSKEEIITMSFPKMEQVKEIPGNSSGKIVQKVSIVTKETPEQIYRAEEVDKNGVKDTIISVIPNNRTGSLEPDMSIDRVDVDVYNNDNNEQSGLDISLPVNKNLQLSEQGTRRVVSSVSWIAEDYHY